MNLFWVLVFAAFYFPISIATIPPGSSLFASNLNQTWRSPNSTFHVGFTQLGSLYVASINYSGGVSVWSAGGPSTPVDANGAFHFRLNGTLQLVNGSGSVLWDSNTSHLGVKSASLDDLGNLVLMNGSGGSVWSSFENPTDTIVSNQNFTKDQILKSGLFSFKVLDSGNLTLRWNDSVVYWNEGLNSSFVVDSNLSFPVLSLQSIGILSISDVSLSSAYIVAYSNDYAEVGDILRFLKLDSDGNLRIYSSALGSGTTTMRWSALADQCQVFGYCGNMGICSYINSSSSPICGCPSQNFEFVDANDRRKGCKRKVEIQNCPGSATMLQLDNAEFLTYQPELASQVFFVGISACRLNCLVSSSCVASTSLSDGTGLCYLKTPNFVSGYQNPALPSTSYVKVCGPVQPNPSAELQIAGNSKRSLRVWVICVVVLATVIFLIAIEGGLWWWCCRHSPTLGSLSAQYALLEYASGAPVQFSYRDLDHTTKGFKEKLGEGGFGAVYKGVLANRTVVAVKRLEGIDQGEKQFRMEVATISSTHHLNLVRLIGYCSEGRHRLLVYEFMKNGSLDNFLFTTDEKSGKLLNWERRFNISLGTARGITYLHEECRDCIVHCDIKPENILLDENYNAKVSDFGLAKLINSKDHRYRTLKSVRGTRGYLAPEWLANLPITSKSDVYSYGMVLLEIVSGRRNFDVSEETNRKRFSVWAFEEFEKDNVSGIVDKRLTEDVDIQQATRAIQVSLWCIQEQPSLRPTMGKVVQMLEGIIDIEKPPAPNKLKTEGSGNSMSISMSSYGSASALSTLADSASAPTPSSFSSFQTIGVSPLPSVRNTEKTSMSLLGSEPN
ncbi:G-type lectin S-receptor-like serine/threonine-protein kinase At1g34300 [Mercurialis annua]|uniref:G-type lectin S-receptor-like serine/threonine-protein kinase At1g34300 n=1 Tax=Mercurialis annua TaxID=3986 RepID=UPI00215E13C7|nr:G-type lectin S-receptor-like serine/threonine-protein kinase At1g34300 [Mercurialis annua]